MRPHVANFGKRLVKMPKLYMTDVGLPAALAGIQNDSQMQAHPLRGPLFETLVVNAFLKNRCNAGLREALHFWRDNIGTEVDLIIERGHEIAAVEITSGPTVASDAFRNLHKWRKYAAERGACSAIHPGLVHGGSERFTREDVDVLPWLALSPPTAFGRHAVGRCRDKAACARPVQSPAMGTLYLVRHGQASFGADDYDQLSEQGQRQSVRLGEHFAFKGIAFEATLTGTLRRHAQTFAGIKAGMEAAGTPPLPEPSAWPGLNEYDSAAVIATVHPEALQKPTTPELYKHHFRLLRQGLAAWMAGRVQPEGMPTYTAFRDGIAAVLDHVRTRHTGNVLLVSSGGPISTAVGQVLGTTPETTIDLNMRIRNSAVTEFVYTPSRHVLLTYNTLPHLDHPDHAGWITFA